ncbi:MAG: PcfJ domain-containing protein [Ruminococcus sp.]|nr:PcfJ domain-containing protein [Ruminococcus sp.]
MRKGQEKILQYAHKRNYSDGCIKALSREDLTLKQLNNLLSLLYHCRNKDEKWVDIFASIDDNKLMWLIIRYMTGNNVDISAEELKQMSTKEKICSYFSQNDLICRNLFDVEAVMTIGNHEYTATLFKLANKIHDKLAEYKYVIFSIVKNIRKCLDCVSDYQDFLDGIDIETLCQNNQLDDQYMTDYIRKYARNHTVFTLKNVAGIPEDIQQINFHGYYTEITTNGFSRNVNYDLKAVYITYKPFSKVLISPDGTAKTNTWESTEKQLIFSNQTHEFITGYETKKGFRYKPAQLKELFFAISICDTDEDRQNAYSVIDFICKKYDTYIFRDLYEDFLASDGLLLPLLITETAQYKTKQELFEKHYHMSVNGNWNRKNSNLTYLILKLRPRMTNEALARAMQCKNAPKIKKVGKRRYVMTYILYETLYGIPVGNFHGDGLLSDALYEEYHNKKIKLLPQNQTINEHNARQVNQRAKTVKFRIRKDTKFRKLIKNMPENYELIKTPKRLVSEGILQKNCVAGYADIINSDKCMIYSVVFENVRHTIEIIQVNGHYKVAQCYKACNQVSNPQLLKDLKDLLHKINYNQTEKEKNK